MLGNSAKEGPRKRKWRVAGIVSSETRSEVDFVRSVLLVEGWLRGLQKEEPQPAAPTP